MKPASTKDVRGIILAGTHQWSRSAFDRAAPRVLLPVAGSPLMGYAMRWLRKGGVTGVSVCANSETCHVRRRLGDGSPWDLELSYYEDVSPRGPAGCVRDAAMTWPARDVIVVEGTVVPGFDLDDLLANHRATGAAITVAARRTASVDTVEGGFESAGVYVFSQAAVHAVPSTGFQDIKEMLIPRVHAAGLGVNMYEIAGSAWRVTAPSSYLSLNARVLEWMAGKGIHLPGYATLGQAYVHETAVIEDGAGLYGPVLVGPHSRIAERARVIGPAVIGCSCQVSPGAVVCRSVLWDTSVVDTHALVDRCVVTTGIRVAPESAWHAMVLDASAAGPIRETHEHSEHAARLGAHWGATQAQVRASDDRHYRRWGRRQDTLIAGQDSSSVAGQECSSA